MNYKCQLGNDCDDCGVRTYHECSTECFKYMMDDGYCNDGCNVAECGYNDCSLNEIFEKCLPSTPRSMRDAPTASNIDSAYVVSSNTSNLPVTLVLQMKALSVLYDAGTGEAYVKIKIVQTVTWTDLRLADSVYNPCRGVLPMLLSISRDEAISDTDRVMKTNRLAQFYTPEATIYAPLKKDTDELIQATFSYGPSCRARSSRGDQLAAYEASCLTKPVSLEIERKFFVREKVHLEDYPFDSHELKILLQPTAGSDILNCGQESLLGLTVPDNVIVEESEFYLLGPGIHSKVLQVGNATLCEIIVPVKRSTIVYFIQEFFPAVLIVFCGLGALWLEPTAPPLVGGRCSLIIIAMLLIINVSLRGTTARTTNYIKWTDYVSWAQIMILFTALLETLTVHALIIRGESRALAIAVDGAMRYIIPATNILLVTILILVGTKHWGAMVAVTVVGSGMLLTFGVRYVQQQLINVETQRLKLIGRLNTLTAERSSTSSAAYVKGMREVFDHLDADRSGKLSRREMESLLIAMESWMSRKEAIKIMGSLTCFLDLDDGCSFDEFGEALQEIEHMLAMPSWLEKRERAMEFQQTITPMKQMLFSAFSPLQMAKARAQHEPIPVSPESPECKSPGLCSSTSSDEPSKPVAMSTV